MKKFRYFISVIIILCIAILFVAGCSTNHSNLQSETPSADNPMVFGDEDVVDFDEPITIQVLTDYYLPSSAAYGQMEYLIDQFEKSHLNVTVEWIIPPSDQNSKVNAIDWYEDMQQDIAQGNGPDVYLLTTAPAANLIFPDVTKAMREGVFLDLNACYNTDLRLNTNNLNSVVMDAGTVNGVQYTLPLRYDLPVVYTAPEQLSSRSLSDTVFSGSVINMMDTFTWLEDIQLAEAADFTNLKIPDGDYYILDFFSELVNYDTGEVLLSADELAQLLYSHTQLRNTVITSGQEAETFNGDYVAFMNGTHWAEQQQGFWISSIGNAIQTAAMCNVLDCNLETYPLTGVDGRIVAEVSFFGAVDANTEHPQVAYDFLRLFLAEESQWEQNVPENNMNPYMTNFGYCVQTNHSAAPYFQSIQARAARNTGLLFVDDESLSVEERTDRMCRMNMVEITDADVPILQVQIDVARYPLSLLEYELKTAYSNAIADNPKDPDIQSVAERFVQSLEQHMESVTQK